MSVESRMAERRNELFEDLVQFVEQRLMEYGEPANKASVLANALRLKRFGGSAPKGQKPNPLPRLAAAE